MREDRKLVSTIQLYLMGDMYVLLVQHTVSNLIPLPTLLLVHLTPRCSVELIRQANPSSAENQLTKSRPEINEQGYNSLAHRTPSPDF